MNAPTVMNGRLAHSVGEACPMVQVFLSNGAFVGTVRQALAQRLVPEHGECVANRKGGYVKLLPGLKADKLFALMNPASGRVCSVVPIAEGSITTGRPVSSSGKSGTSAKYEKSRSFHKGARNDVPKH